MDHRQRRVADQVRAILSELIVYELKDPGLGFATVTEVRMSKDLQHARVFVSVMGEEDAEGNSLASLRRASGFLRRELGRQLRLRHIPELQFVLDETLAHSERIEQLLHDNPSRPEAEDDDAIAAAARPEPDDE